MRATGPAIPHRSNDTRLKRACRPHFGCGRQVSFSACCRSVRHAFDRRCNSCVGEQFITCGRSNEWRSHDHRRRRCRERCLSTWRYDLTRNRQRPIGKPGRLAVHVQLLRRRDAGRSRDRGQPKARPLLPSRVHPAGRVRRSGPDRQLHVLLRPRSLDRSAPAGLGQ